MTLTRVFMTTFALGLLSSVALADPPYPEYPATHESMMDRMGVALTLGAGVAGFTSERLRNTTTDGGMWNLQATLGTRSVLAFEAAYSGSAQSIDALGLASDSVLVSNGLQANVRVNLQQYNAVQPFLFAGVGWRRYDITNTSRNLSLISDSDDVFEIPLGVGVAFRHRHFVLDGRAEFRVVTGADLVPSITANDPLGHGDMHRYGAFVSAGYEF